MDWTQGSYDTFVAIAEHIRDLIPLSCVSRRAREWVVSLRPLVVALWYLSPYSIRPYNERTVCITGAATERLLSRRNGLGDEQAVVSMTFHKKRMRFYFDHPCDHYVILYKSNDPKSSVHDPNRPKWTYSLYAKQIGRWSSDNWCLPGDGTTALLVARITLPTWDNAEPDVEWVPRDVLSRFNDHEKDDDDETDDNDDGRR